MANLDKQALTPLELSPEETYEASTNLGRSLFSALQLAREKELRRKMKEQMDFEGGDSNTLQIPIPASLLQPKMAAAKEKVTFSITENPDGTLSYNKDIQGGSATALKSSKKFKGIGGAAGLYLGGVPGGIAGTAAGSLLDAPDAYSSTPKHIGSSKNLDGSIEHIYEMQPEKGVAPFIKRHMGKALGAAGAASLISHSQASPALKTLGSLASVLGGAKLDRMLEEISRKEIMNNPKTKADMLSDMQLRKLSKESSDSADFDPGVFSKAFEHLHTHPAKMLIGAREGFKNAKRDYYMEQKALIAQELMKAQKEYIDTLSRIKTGSLKEETPNVDAFCNGIAHMALFGKTASYRDVDIEEGSLNRILANLRGKVTAPLNPVKELAAQGMMDTAAASAYMTYLLKKKMREEPEKYMSESLPSRVELVPYK